MNANIVELLLPGRPCICTRSGSRVRVETLVSATAQRSAMSVMKVEPTPFMVRDPRRMWSGYPRGGDYLEPAENRMPLTRCPHGVYSPNGPDEPSPYCSGCNPNSLGICDGDGLLMSLDDLRDDPFMPVCPACGGDLVVRDEFDFECPDCGFDDL